jgi:hypothetical protein
MSVYKSAKSAPYFWYDFQIDGRRFHGSTRCTSRREAEKVEAQERDRAKAVLKAAHRAAVSLELDHVAARYWAARDSTIPARIIRPAIWRGWSIILASLNC